MNYVDGYGHGGYCHQCSGRIKKNKSVYVAEEGGRICCIHPRCMDNLLRSLYQPVQCSRCKIPITSLNGKPIIPEDLTPDDPIQPALLHVEQAVKTMATIAVLVSVLLAVAIFRKPT